MHTTLTLGGPGIPCFNATTAYYDKRSVPGANEFALISSSFESWPLLKLGAINLCIYRIAYFPRFPSSGALHQDSSSWSVLLNGSKCPSNIGLDDQQSPSRRLVQLSFDVWRMQGTR